MAKVKIAEKLEEHSSEQSQFSGALGVSTSINYDVYRGKNTQSSQIEMASEPILGADTIAAEDTRFNTSIWGKTYARRIALADFLVLVAAVTVAQFVTMDWKVQTGEVEFFTGKDFFHYCAVSVLIILIWMAVLSLANTRDKGILGQGVAEYSRAANASFSLFGGIAICVYLFKIDMSRGVVLLAFPLGLAALLLIRWMHRKWLHRQWRNGKMLTRVLVVGSEESVQTIVDRLYLSKPCPYSVVGVTSARDDRPHQGTTFEIRGNLVDVLPYGGNISEQMRELGADTLIVAGGHLGDGERVRELGWNLDPNAQHLIVSPGIVDIGGPRIAMTPVSGMPLIHVHAPSMSKISKGIKRTFDIFAVTVGLILISPVMIFTALAVKLCDGGPVFFRQERVGYKGEKFGMLKFRSMHVDAEKMLNDLRSQQSADAGNSILFKMKDDPRITKVGKFIRRFSLDELPQLFNVWMGSMSLVGPRPPLATEVESYEEHVHRRFFVKPGITGLWQVNGRSNLSWEDSVRLDLFYVENWTFLGDLRILIKTGKAVIGSDGAY